MNPIEQNPGNDDSEVTNSKHAPKAEGLGKSSAS